MPQTGCFPTLSHTSYQKSPEFKNFLENKNIIQDSFGIPLVTEQQVCLYLEDLDPKKAAGIDNIGARDLKGVKPGIVKHLCNIVNTSIECGTFPKPWKEAKVTPLHKGGSKENMDNYRPISLLSTASKIFERHVLKYLYNFFCDNNLLCDNQSGFRGIILAVRVLPILWSIAMIILIMGILLGW